MKKVLFLSVLLAVLLVATACTTPATENTTDSAQKDCGEDLVCGNQLLKDCTPGIFSAMGGNVMVKTEVLGKSGNNCELIETIALTDLAPFATAEHDKDGDGYLDMNCELTSNATDFDALTATLKVDYAKYCKGELKDFYDFMFASFK